MKPNLIRICISDAHLVHPKWTKPLILDLNQNPKGSVGSLINKYIYNQRKPFVFALQVYGIGSQA